MTGKRVSREQVKVMDVLLADSQQWVDSNTVAFKCAVPSSSVRHFLLTFYKLGLLERVEMHNGYRYRPCLAIDDHPYLLRLRRAATVMRK
jgi:hypothetical protein